MATSWDEPDCPRCRRDFHRIQTGPERGLGVYSECPPCEAARRARSAAAAESARRRAIVSESAEHWRKLRRSERGEELAEELEAVEGDEGALPNPLQDGDSTIEPSPKDGRLVHITVAPAHIAPGRPSWKVSEYDRGPTTEIGEIVGTWTIPDFRGFGPDWLWAARSLSSGKISYIHPMDVRWAKDADTQSLSRGEEGRVDMAKNPPAEVTIRFVVPKAFLLGIAKALAELGSRDDEVSSLIRNGASCRPDGLFLTLPDDRSVLQAVRRSARQLAGDATADTTIRVRAMDVVNALDKAMEE